MNGGTESWAAKQLDGALLAERQNQPETALELVGTLPVDALDAARLNALGSLLMRLRQPARAADAFGRAHGIAPDEAEYAMNQAIALTAADQGEAALLLLRSVVRIAGRLARYWSIRANAARSVNDLAEAQACYAEALRQDPLYGKAQQGLAQVALERADPAAVALYRRAMAAGHQTPWLWRGLAEALAAAGELEEALQLARTIVEQLPQWPDGLRLLADLRLASGDAAYLDHFANSVARFPDDPALPDIWISLLAGLDNHREAMRVAQEAASRFPQMPHFALLAALHAGSAGDDEAAERAFRTLSLQSSERFLHEARHRLRLGQVSEASTLLDRVLLEEPWNVTAWALRDLCWRLADDPRHAWLHGQEGLVQHLKLSADPALLAEAVETLRVVHERSSLPLDQSLRGGTQTRGSLFGRHEPVFARLRAAITDTLEAYRKHLPPADADHPLLRRRDAPWRFAGSWSVRLLGGGDHHTAHIHPQGIVSSALYLLVPAHGPGEAELELGRPAPDLRLDLPPLRVIDPEPGTLALFPSTLYHGTTPFRQAERLTVAFDVTDRSAA